jgi:hypothetical protein
MGAKAFICEISFVSLALALFRSSIPPDSLDHLTIFLVSAILPRLLCQSCNSLPPSVAHERR